MYEFIKEKEIDEIVLEHIINSKKIEEKSRELIRSIFKQTFSMILIQVKAHIENNDKFKSTKDIYQLTNTLKDEYFKYSKLDYIEEIVNENEQEILQGIFKTINSIIEEFPKDIENPFEQERLLIISTGMSKIEEAMNKIKEDIVYNFQMPNTLYISISEVVEQYLLDSILRLYKKIHPIIEKTIEELNKYSNREVMNRYYKHIKSQRFLISNYTSFIFEIGNGDKENNLTQKFIKPLQNYVVQITEILQIVDDSNKHVLIIEELDIVNVDKTIHTILIEDTRFKKLVEVVEDYKHTMVERVLTHINDELTKITTAQLNRLRKDSNKFELLSCFVLELFEEGLQCVNKHDVIAVKESIQGKIIKGVKDTLYLKYTSLKDKDEVYHMRKKEDYLIVAEKFIDFKSRFENNLEDFLSQAIAGSKEEMLSTQVRFTKLLSQVFKENFDKDIEYLRKDFLFEIKTFEDLIDHSIERLKESEDVVCHEFADCVDLLYEKILTQLKRCDIIQVKPKAHEIFNGKLHEVLVTESLNGFEKGEIIRFQNSGYVLGAQVLQRASVIVAK